MVQRMQGEADMLHGGLLSKHLQVLSSSLCRYGDSFNRNDLSQSSFTYFSVILVCSAFHDPTILNGSGILMVRSEVLYTSKYHCHFCFSCSTPTLCFRLFHDIANLFNLIWKSKRSAMLEGSVNGSHIQLNFLYIRSIRKFKVCTKNFLADQTSWNGQWSVT